MSWHVAPDPRRPLVYDGLEGEPAPITFSCRGCGRALVVDLGSVSARSVGADGPRYGLVSRPVLTWTIADTAEGLTAYDADVPCACGAAHRVVFGLSEVQPARYQISLVGVWIP
jgi:hypothetical protein